MEHNCINISITKKPDSSEVEIQAEVTIEAVARYRTKALKMLGLEAKLDGFRPGHIPEKILIEHVGEAALMREAANEAIAEEIPLLLAHENIFAIATPKVTITKLAPGNPIAFTALVEVMPEVTLPEYKKIAASHNKKKIEVSVTEDEVKETTTHLRRERARIEKIESGADAAQAAQEVSGIAPDELPPLDDAFAKQLGFEDAGAFDVKLRENIKNEKELREREKRRIAIVEEIIEKSKMSVPKTLIEQEIDSIEARFASDVERSGETLETYLTHTKKTREQLRSERVEPATKRAKMHLVLREISQKETIVANPLDIEGELKHIVEQHPNANFEAARAYVETTLKIEAVFKWLEEQA